MITLEHVRARYNIGTAIEEFGELGQRGISELTEAAYAAASRGNSAVSFFIDADVSREDVSDTVEALEKRGFVVTLVPNVINRRYILSGWR